MAKHGLGKGLDAILGSSQSTTKSGERTTQIASGQKDAIKNIAQQPIENEEVKNAILFLPIEKILPNPSQPRQHFDANALAELVASIKEHGILQPLIVRKLSTGNYEIIAGERRWRAANEAGLKEVPAVVREASPEQIMELSLVENLQREDLNPIEEAEGYATLASKFGLTQEKIAEKVGKARATITNALRLLELPDEIKKMLADGTISTGHAKVLMSVPIDDEKILLARQIAKEGLSVRALERIVSKRFEENKSSTLRVLSKPSVPDPHIRHLIDELQRHLGTSVRITLPRTMPDGKKAKGVVEIDLFSDEDLDRILKILGMSGM